MQQKKCKIKRLEAIFKIINLEKLSESEVDELVAPIREREIREVIKSLKNKKIPGSDGLLETFTRPLWQDLCQNYIRFLVTFCRKTPHQRP